MVLKAFGRPHGIAKAGVEREEARGLSLALPHVRGSGVVQWFSSWFSSCFSQETEKEQVKEKGVEPRRRRCSGNQERKAL